MTEDDPVGELAARALRFWESGALEEAVELYREALALCGPDHWALPMYVGELAGVLAQLGRKAEALEQYERALACELRLEPTGESNSVATARYFLGEYLLLLGEPARVLETIEPSLRRVVAFEGLLQMLKAEALARLGREGEAKAAARAALDAATSGEQRDKILERVGAWIPKSLPS